MATNCYDLGLAIELCVDGPVGGGNTATLSIFSNSSLVSSLGTIATVPGWGGELVSFDSWATGGGTCDLDSAELSVQLVGENQVRLRVEIQLSNCSDSFSGIYSGCDDLPGPHQFFQEEIVEMTGAGCQNGGSLPFGP